jgi:hypothetical protein
MKVELIISKERVPYILEEFKDRVTVSDYDKDSDSVCFEITSQLDVLYVFHAGIRFGQETMAQAFTK